MKKRLHMWLLLAITLLLTMGMQAQIKVLQEDFESGIPSSWSQDPTTVTVSWNTGSSGVSTLAPQNGSAFAMLYATSPQSSVQLITPQTDISSLSNPVVSFWYAQPSFSTGDFDTLRVYYRTSSTSNWELLYTGSTAQASWIHQEISLLGITGTSIQVGFEYTYGVGRGIALDNMYIGDAAVCTPPTNLSAYRITHQSAELMWSSHDQSIGYSLKVSSTPMTDMTATADVFDSEVYYKPYTVTGLSASTTYYFYVKADCDQGDISSWSAQGTFTTACSPAILPLSEGFDSYGTGTGTFPSCWTKMVSYSGDWGTSTPSAYYTPYCYASTKRTGAASLYMSAYYSASSSYTSPRISKCIAATHAISDAINLTQVTFWAYSANKANKLHVGIMTDPTDVSTFEEVAELQVSSASTWEEFIIPFSTNQNGGKYIAFMVDAADRLSETTYMIDDVIVELIPPCPKPSFVRMVSSDSTSITLGWTASNASSWRVKASTTAMTDMTATADGFDGTINSNPGTITGLLSNTDYYVYVQSDCAEDSLSVWSNEVKCSTQCGAISSFPYSENFDSYRAKTLPDCWFSAGDYLNYNVTYPSIDSSNYTASAPKSLKFVSEVGIPSYAITPGINSTLNSLQIKFSMKAESTTSSGVMEVGVMTNPYDTTTFQLVKRIQPTSTTMTDYEVNLINVTVPGLNNHIAFRHITNSSYYYYWLDDVVIDSLPTCIAPANLQTRNITSEAATLYWSAALNESQWNVKVSSTALSNPQNDIADTYTGSVSIDSLRVSGLKMGVTYNVYIQSDCGNEVSSWESYTFTTQCGDITNLPFTETFTGLGSGSSVMVPCWQRVPSSYPYVSTGYNNTANVTGSGCLYYSGSTSYPKEYAILPKVNIVGKSIQDMQVSFAMRTSTIGTAIVVGVMTSPTDTSTFVPVDTIFSTSANSFNNYLDISFASYTGTGSYIAFLNNMAVTGSSYNSIYLDDIRLELIPTCKTPIDLAVTGILDTEISVDWSARSGETNWELVLGTPGFDPDTSSSILMLTQSNYTFTGLTARTGYQIYVRSDCGATDGKSLWSSALNITTSAEPEELPLNATFEDETDNAKWILANGGQTNHWIIGSGASNGGSKSIYITNATSETSPNIYSSSSTSYAMAYRTLRFTPGMYQISFDWECAGEGNYDLGRVFLIEPSVELVGGSGYGMTSSTNTVPTGWIPLDGGVLSSQGVWANKTYLLTITEEKIYNLALFWKNDGSMGTNPSFTVDNLIVQPLTCAPASDFTILATDSSINLSWPNLVMTPLWDVKVSTTALSIATIDTQVGDVFNDTVTSSRVNVQGLTANTPYYFYIRTHCADGSLEEWSEVIVNTECDFVSRLPYEEHFDGYGSSTFAPCWTKAVAYNSYPYLSGSVNHTTGGNASMYFYTNSWDGTTNNVIASPRITADSIKNLLVSCYGYDTSTGSYIEIGVMTNPADGSTFVAVDTLTIQTASTWNYIEANMSSYTGNGEYIAFRTGDASTYNYIYLDDIRIIDNRSCKQPEGLNVTRITTDGGRLSWSSNGMALYNVKVSSTEIDPYLEEGDVMELSELQDAYITLNGLTQNTTYYFYVQADCGDAVPSYWSEGCKFTTLCSAQPVPYVENFTGYGSGVGVMPDCWVANQEIHGSVTGSYVPYINKGVFYGNDSLSLRLSTYYSRTTSGETVNLLSVKSLVSLPMFTSDLNVLSMSFNNYSANEGAKLSVGVMTDVSDASTFDLIDTILLGAWQRSTVSFANYQGQPGYITFMIDAEGDEFSTLAYIDQVSVDSISECQAATSLESRNITSDGAELYWGSLSANDSIWHIQVTTFDAGYNTNQLDTITAFIVDTVVTGNSLVVTGLNALTNYYYYARPVCNNVDGPRYPSSKMFRTACGRASLPYSESFDIYGTGDGTMAECWQGFTTYTSYYITTPYLATSYYSSPASMSFNTSSSTYTYAVLPEFDIDSVQKLQLSFMAQGTELQIGVMTDPSDFSTFDSLTTIGLSSWSEYSVSLSNYTGNGKYITFLCDRRFMSSYCYFNIDDVLVQLQPTCFRPASISASNRTENGVTLSWPANSNESSYDVAIVNNGGDPNSVSPINVAALTYTSTGLQPSTTYQAYVRSNCGDGDVSAWRGPVTFNTLQIPATLPFISTFDSNNEGWTLENGSQTNQFFIGSAVSNTGSGSLYISNTNGATHNYNPSSSSKVYAYRLLTFNPGSYTVSYDWLCYAEEGYDFGRVYLVPSQAAITSGSTPGSTWISLDNGAMADYTSWQSVVKSIGISETANYYVVVYFTNDYSYGDQPPLAIDNFSVVAEECYAPVVTINNLTATSASINWVADGDSVMAKVSSVNIPTGALDTTTANVWEGIQTNQSFDINGLTAQTTYYVYVRSFCSNGDTTAWVSSSFTTECTGVLVNATNNLTENFDSYDASDYTADIQCWTRGTNSSGVYPRLYTYNYLSSPNALYFYSSIEEYCYIASPRIVGTAVNDLQVRYSQYQGSSDYYILVGVMTNPSDVSTFVKIDSVNCSSTYTWEEKTVRFEGYTGTGQYVAFKVGPGSYTYPYIDDVTIEVAPSCAAPTIITASNQTASSMTFSWVAAATDSMWHIKVFTDMVAAEGSNTADVLDSIITGTPTIALTGLNASSTYSIIISKICSATESSDWSVAKSAATSCGVVSAPYSQSFTSSDFPPQCWNRYNGILGQNITPVTSGWRRLTTNALTDGHAALNLYGSSVKSWIVTPQISITNPSIVSFDLALTDLGNGNPIEDPSAISDDRFIVVASTDNGSTWDTTHMVVWNDVNGDYSMSAIPTTGSRYSVNLSHYVGQTIKVGFYGESLLSGSDNDIHIDNISINEVTSVSYTDEVCVGYPYAGYGFNIAATDLSQAGSYSFSRVGSSTSGLDTVIMLSLVALPNSVEYLTAEICSGDVYSQNGFVNLTTSGTYRRNLVASSGCDSTVVLTLTVMGQGAAQNSNISVCQSELPYVWRGMSLTSTGVYNDTLVSAAGCDSILSLTFNVLPEYNVTDRLTLNDTDLPYTYMDTVFTASTAAGETTHVIHGETAAGCDSTVTLTLTILTVGVNDINGDYFELYPNPVVRDQMVTVAANFTEAELEGMVVEVFNSVGECVKTIHPTELPIRINGFAASGVYLVRVTTATNRVVYGKVVVR